MNKKPTVMINSVPKSGTHLMVQIIQGIPGFHLCKYYYQSTLSDIRFNPEGVVAVGHFPYNEKLFDNLKKWGIRLFFISRDPRDVAVSLAHFYMRDNLKDHPMHTYFKKYTKSHTERLSVIINGADLTHTEIPSKHGWTGYPNLYQHLAPIYQWFRQPVIIKTTFEKLVDPQTRTKELTRFIDYLWEDIRPLNLSKQEIMERMNDNIRPLQSSTFRKGEVGTWKNEFLPEHKNDFKRVAGSLLIDLKYEQNQDW
ncbi:sulfotransferase domain-containing protein [Desmospora profundinema]|uniref:Sulfotransferase domain-containing protein n=1 Tax=Desmospora profundinema TaxID=1571184 RepID=A0ABU1IHT0_9BACL|nr:sulfotransferase domain-containing protein [Desmospora profundinema]MDR6224329.1 hypothetical protein [Desmospora profundinema]